MDKKTPDSVFQIGDHIKTLRKERNLTQKELGDEIGVSAQVISNWERGYTSPTPEDIVELAKAFNASTDEVITGHDRETINEYLMNSMEISGHLQVFMETHGEKMVAQIFNNNLDIEDLLNSSINITFEGTVLTEHEKKKSLI
ncbi:TPA: helix-turn-helix domain-containing protein [Bacillus cereus]